ncbi:MAG: SDR family oxidoreductase [Myxococcales bacterium]|nr:SDR family oxidoreductase [Myxococcales bacterium]
MRDLAGRVAVVTGAARGIGREIARTFAAGGADIALSDIDAERLAEARTEIEKTGVRAVSVAGDVGTESHAAELIGTATSSLGRIDTLVNNAGVWIIKTVEETTPEEWDRQHSTNLRSLYLMSRAATPALRESRGCIVNIASIAAFRFTVPHVAYASSKAGVVAFTRDLAVELAPDRVRVNAVAPGPIDTQGLFDGLSDAERAKACERFMLGRIGAPRDIATAVAFLASDDASYITGVTLPVTGGAELAARPLQ